MSFEQKKSLTIISVVVIICGLIIFVPMLKDRTLRKEAENYRAERLAYKVSRDSVQSNPVKEHETILGFKVIAREDVSYSNVRRMVYRIVLDVNEIPLEADIQSTGKSIWKDGNTSWREFTVFVYLPGMRTDLAAYAFCEFRPNGLLKFQINEYTIQGTKWE